MDTIKVIPNLGRVKADQSTIQISFWLDKEGYHIMHCNTGTVMNFANLKNLISAIDQDGNYIENEQILIGILLSIQQQYPDFNITFLNKDFNIVKASVSTIWP